MVPNYLIDRLTKYSPIQVTNITWSSTKIPLEASGVQFGPSGGGSTRYTAQASREVILAAGAIQTPALLQLSGIGDPAVLGPLGIPTLLNMKTVGRNFQEQVTLHFLYTFPAISDRLVVPRHYYH